MKKYEKQALNDDVVETVSGGSSNYGAAMDPLGMSMDTLAFLGSLVSRKTGSKDVQTEEEDFYI